MCGGDERDREESKMPARSQAGLSGLLSNPTEKGEREKDFRGKVTSSGFAMFRHALSAQIYPSLSQVTTFPKLLSPAGKTFLGISFNSVWIATLNVIFMAGLRAC